MALESISLAKNNVYSGDIANVKQSVGKGTQTRQAEEQAVKPTEKPEVGTFSKENKGNTEINTEEPMPDKVKDAVNKVNEKMIPSKTRCEFSYHEDTKRISIKVVDQNTEEVIKEIPPEETLDMLSKFWEFAGLLVDERR